LPGTERVWEAFWHLTTDREIGMGVGPVPWTAMDRYAARHAIDDPDDFDEFVELITAMDQAYLDHCRTEQDRQAKASKSASRGRR